MAKRKKSDGVVYVVFQCGYAEDARMGWMTYEYHGSDEGFATSSEAISDLAMDLYAKYECDVLDFNNENKRDCCRGYAASNSTSATSYRYCPHCGRQLEDIRFERDQFERWLHDLNGGTIDGYRSAEQHRWWPWPDIRDVFDAHVKGRVAFMTEGESRAEETIAMEIEKMLGVIEDDHLSE